MTDEAEPEHDVWADDLKLSCASYNGQVDQEFVAVMSCIIDDRPAYVTDIAQKTGLTPTHVELIQYILCSADLCEYGTSPRGCWPIDDGRFRRIISALASGGDVGGGLRR